LSKQHSLKISGAPETVRLFIWREWQGESSGRAAAAKFEHGSSGGLALPSTLAPLAALSLTPRVSDRLTELQRQRALAQEQLEWFDREIARERGEAVFPVTPAVTPSPSFASASAARSVATRSAAESDAQATEIIKRYQKTERPVKDDVRRGCFLYFFAAFLLLGLAVATFYLLYRPAE